MIKNLNKSNLSNKLLVIKYGVEKYLIKNLEIFVPPASGDYKVIGKETLNAANSSFPLLSQLQSLYSKKINLIKAKKFSQLRNKNKVAENLKKLFNKFGSDKSIHSDYHLVYSSLFKNKTRPKKILEIGIGSKDVEMISNMGSDGVPGASLKAFKEYFNSAIIYGADYDKKTLFQEHRIKTFFVDQSQIKSLKNLFSKIPGKVDLIIDDGLHAIHANLNVIIVGLKNLNKNGWIVIEDIPLKAMPVWKIVSELLSEKFETHIVVAKNGLMFLINKKF